MIKPLTGIINISGDKSISHRALILSSQTIGTTFIKNLSNGSDVYRTVVALQQLGVPITKNKDNIYQVSGVGTGGLSRPNNVLNMGNSGTSARLFMGLVAPYPFVTFFTGDTSLRKRPMQHIITALETMGVNFLEDKLPLAVIGFEDTIPTEYTLPIASAQLKSAILLCALNTQGTTTIIEPKPFCRDHTEIMLKNLGANLTVKYDNNNNKIITLDGQPELRSINEMHIPSDPSSASFLVAAALTIPGSEITIQNVCINPTRIGFYQIIKRMGANITFNNIKTIIGEKVADITVKYSKLTGVTVDPQEVPATIDEFPILSILAAYAEGKTYMPNLEQLRVKESDRIATIINNLKRCQVKATEKDNTVSIIGNGKVIGGCTIKTHKDHRIAMSFMVANLSANKPIKVDSTSSIKTSFPEFLKFLPQL